MRRPKGTVHPVLRLSVVAGNCSVGHGVEAADGVLAAPSRADRSWHALRERTRPRFGRDCGGREQGMSYLVVPGARLYYAIRGNGPLLVLVPGANGDAAVFSRVAEHLAGDYTVVTYDRRGFTRSHLEKPSGHEDRLATDAGDAGRVIEHLDCGPATVFGTSSGAIVALELLTRHPTIVGTLVAYEPAAMRQLPDGQRWVDFVHELYRVYCHSGLQPALAQFRKHMVPESDRQLMASATGPHSSEQVHANAAYWLECELRQYATVELDLTALTAHASRIMPAAGRESRGYPTYEVATQLGHTLGRSLIELPGGHAGFATQPAQFAREFLAAAGATGHAPKQ